MHKTLRALALVGSLLAVPALAADNALIVTPGVGVTVRSVDIGAGVQAPGHAFVNASGTQIGVAGSEVFVGGRGTAGTATGGVLTVQGVASMTPFLTTTTLNAETTKVIGTIRMQGNVGGVLDAIGQNVAAPANWLQTGCQFQTSPTTITAGNGSPIQCDNAGRLLGLGAIAASVASIDTKASQALPAQSTNAVNIGAVMNAGSTYETVAAGVTGQILGGAGAIGDYLSHCVLYPVTTSPGVVTVFDDATGAGANVIAFAGGASSLSNLAPISIPVGAVSVTGEWRVTTGTNVIVTCYGKFT